MTKLTERIKRTTNSHYIQVVAFAVLGLFVGSLFMFSYQSAVDSLSAPEEISVQPEQKPVLAQVQVSDPQRLRIPAVGIDTTFEGPLGLHADQTIEVPDSYEKVGWYKYAPLPGELGPAVILGHVDSYQGPAVFWPLGKTKVGDTIEIERVDGSVALFEITQLDRRPQSDFPTKEVYGDIDYAGLRLITCTGTFDHGKQVYSHNLIVFAKLVE